MLTSSTTHRHLLTEFHGSCEALLRQRSLDLAIRTQACASATSCRTGYTTVFNCIRSEAWIRPRFLSFNRDVDFSEAAKNVVNEAIFMLNVEPLHHSCQ